MNEPELDKTTEQDERSEIAQLKEILIKKQSLPSFSNRIFNPEFNPPMLYKVPPKRPAATEVMRVFNSGIADGETILDTRLLSINAWLAANGDLYACAWRNHHAVLNHFEIRSELEAEKAGFLKLSDMHWHVEARYESLTITSYQIETIEKWHEDNGLSKVYFENCLAKTS
jgi:hypothetical protein